MNSAIHCVRSSLDLFQTYRPLDLGTLHFRAYTDTPFATNDDLSSQLGYFLFLCDSSDNCHVLDFAGRKCKRVVMSIMTGKIYAFAEGLDDVFAIRHTLEKLYKREILIKCLQTPSSCLT